jgi:HEAT repeat protein
LWPLLEALALRAPPESGPREAERQALAAGMLDALGVLRDPRAAPVLRSAFDHGRSAAVVRAAARALGRLCDDTSLELLRRRAAGAGPHTLAAVGGLGPCRRLESAAELVAVLDTAADPAVAEAAAEALGVVGSSWAWRALGPGRVADANAVRQLCARALLSALRRPEARVQRTAARSLGMVEHPDTRRLGQELGTALGPEAQSLLAAVVARIERRLGL